MPETLERAQARLHNISIVKPLLEALKTISLGSWQASQRANRYSDIFRKHLMQVLPQVLSRLSLPEDTIPGRRSRKRCLLVLIGSERGLCGNFNRDLVKKTRESVDRLEAQGYAMRTIVFGSTASRILHREYSGNLDLSVYPMPSVPSPNMAGEWGSAWVRDFDSGSVDRVEIVHNQSIGTSSYETRSTCLIPFVMPRITPGSQAFSEMLLDGKPRSIFSSIIRQLIALDVYNFLLSSSIAEHSTRFRLMDEASRNADDLIDELTLDVQAARRQSITQEMEELAVGSGLL
jgi:F-type H+-transporting ATPase subunit gamma